MNNCNCCYEIVKLKRGGWKCFRAFNTVLFKQKLLQLVLWNKLAPLKEQGNNDFPQINAPFKFSRINQRSFVTMDDCKECCEINSVLNKWIASSAPLKKWHCHRKKMDSYKWCRQITNFFQCIHAWNQEVS